MEIALQELKITDNIYYYIKRQTVIARYGPMDCVETRQNMISNKEKLHDAKYLILEDHMEGAILEPMGYKDDIQFHPLPEFLSHFPNLEKVYYINANAKLKEQIEEVKRRYTGFEKLDYLMNLEYELLYRTQDSFYTNYLQEDKNITDKKYHFISLNGVPKWPRAYVLQQILNSDTNDKIAYSWMKRNQQNIIMNEWKTEFFNPNVIKALDTNNNDIPITQERVPIEYHQSLIDIFVESSPKDEIGLFVTEKTWKPLIIGKPFFGLNSPGYWSYLKDNGFRLYHNLFDYSLDSVTSFDERAKLHIAELKRILDMPLSEVEKILLTHEDDIEYNKNLARTFVGLTYDLLEPYSQNAMCHLFGYKTFQREANR